MGRVMGQDDFAKLPCGVQGCTDPTCCARLACPIHPDGGVHAVYLRNKGTMMVICPVCRVGLVEVAVAAEGVGDEELVPVPTMGHGPAALA